MSDELMSDGLTGHEPFLSIGLNGNEPMLGGPLNDGRSLDRLSDDERHEYLGRCLVEAVQNTFDRIWDWWWGDGVHGNFYGLDTLITTGHDDNE